MSSFFLSIVNMSIAASWLVLAVILLRVVLKKAPKWISVLLWGMVAIRLICPFSIESIFSLIPSAETFPQQVLTGSTFDIQTGIPQIDAPVNDYIGDHYYEGVTVPTDYGAQVLSALTILWLVGIAVMLIYTVVSYLLLRRKVATAVLLKDDRIYQSEYVDSPFVLGLIRPRIYLPYQMDSNDLHHVLAHEQAHIRRKDHWWKPVGFVLLSLHWFNPLMWLGYILLCRDIELACDEKVIKEMDNDSKANYSQALLNCSIHRGSIAACPLAFGEVGVKERIKSVLHYKKPALWILMASIILCTVVAVCFLTNPVPNTLRHIEFEDLGIATEEEVWVSDGQQHFHIGTVEADLIDRLYKLPISDNEISQNRSEDRDKTNTIILVNTQQQKPQMSYLLGMYIHFSADFTQVWVDDGVKPTLSYKVLQPEQAKDVYLRIRSIAGIEIVNALNGNLKTYYQNADGTYQCNGYQYKYRLEITGVMPNASAQSKFVYLSNLENITFQQAYMAAGLSSNTESYFSPYEAVLVDMQAELKLPPREPGALREDDIMSMQATEYLSGQQASLLSFGYTLNEPGHMVIADGSAPSEGNYGQNNTLVLDGEHGQNQIILAPLGATLQRYRICLEGGGVYDEGTKGRVLQADGVIVLIAPNESGTYIYELQLDWPEQEMTVEYGLKIVMSGEENGYDRSLKNILAAYGEGNPQIEVSQVDRYTLANSVYSSKRYLFEVDNVPGAPIWVETDAQTGQIYMERDDPKGYLVDPPYIKAQTAQEKVYSGILDSVSFDIDGDGKEEMCTLGVGPTYGLFSFTFIASPIEVTASGPKYSEVFMLGNVHQVTFEIVDDALKIRGDGEDKTVYFDIAVRDGHILLQCDEEDMFFTSIG